MSKKRTIEDMRALAAGRGGACVSTKYEDAHTKLLWQCADDHQWWAKPNAVASAGSWCPICDRSTTSVGERISREVLEAMFGHSFPKRRPKWLKTGPMGGCMELDGFADGMSLAFEYHGAQHYEARKDFGGEGSFIVQQKRYTLKAKLCQEHGVRLLVIPQFKNIVDLSGCIDQIEHAVLWCGLKIPRGWKRPTKLHQIREPLTRLFGTSGLHSLRAIAAEKGGSLLSCSAATAADPLLWKCSVGHEWQAPSHRIRSNHWCPDCAGNKKKTIHDMSNLAATRSGVFLSSEYVGQGHKHIWQCAAGHVFHARPDDVKQGHWCPDCAGLRKKTLSDMHTLAGSRNGKFLSPAYLGNRVNHQWQCEAGHVFHTKPAGVTQGNWCPSCYNIRRKKTPTTIHNQSTGA